MAVDVKQAIQIAKEYFVGVFAAHEYADLRLEEVERAENGLDCWLITLGFYGPNPLHGTDASVATKLGLNRRTDRQYKIIAIDVASGEVLSMKIREVARI